ncbi:hypothetical protein K461DRAFT_112069 [Myriangium duriaei CBS 260.36]|uniref:Uncharacterized protein n=1 Tax=Myriangium duriaei CBS 260.36 TaxID=1168546 RepID=A0A9P4J774_9PEZI|nr:hypothetical protein K461DRAFT_112069 [Myriangium duriaei CBS 260.36]
MHLGFVYLEHHHSESALTPTTGVSATFLDLVNPRGSCIHNLWQCRKDVLDIFQISAPLDRRLVGLIQHLCVEIPIDDADNEGNSDGRPVSTMVQHARRYRCPKSFPESLPESLPDSPTITPWLVVEVELSILHVANEAPIDGPDRHAECIDTALVPGKNAGDVAVVTIGKDVGFHEIVVGEDKRKRNQDMDAGL